MTPDPTPQADPAVTLQREVYRHVLESLCAMWPFPQGATQEACTRQIHAAVAQIAALVPANADEADLAAHYVATSAHASERLTLALRNARYPAGDKCRAEASSMMRHARSYRSLLLRVQAERRKREKDDASRERDAWTEHSVLGLLMGALHPEAVEAFVPAPPPPPKATAPEPEPVGRQAKQAARQAPRRSQEDLAAEAERYALHYPRRAQAIRRHGGLPPNCDFGPPDEALVRAIVTGTTTALRAADTFHTG